MIVDTHTHFYDPGRPQGVPWPAPEERSLYRTVLPEHYRALAEPLGVTGTVVVEASAWLEDNQWVLDLAAAEPFLLGLVGHLEPDDPGCLDHLERFAANPLFRGIRLGGAHLTGTPGGLVRRVLEALARRDLELDVLIGPGELPALAALAGELPALRVVVDHVAGVTIAGGPPDPEWADGMRRVAAWPQVFCKVSALVELSRIQPAPTDVAYYAPVLDLLWDAFGPDRLVYGSNWPVCERAGPYAAVQSIASAYFAAKGPDALERFLWRNAAAAYRWPERAPSPTPQR